MTPPDAAALVGRTIGGAFHLQALIGQGGFGAVYRAVDTRLDRTVAVKVALKGHDPQMGRRFRREARSQADLRHRGIVRLLEFGMHDGMPYLVQEFVDGVTLRAVVDARGPLAPARAGALFGQLLDALDEAHARGVVHRDIKPENIMLVDGRKGEEVRLCDFGIAKVLEPENGTETLTPYDAVIGSVSWLAPEQAGPGEITARTDLYSVGCVMFWALTGRKPFEGTARQVILSHVAQPPPPIPAHVPPMLADAIRRAMHKAPADRFPSAEAMARVVRGHAPTVHDDLGFLDPADVNTYESGLSRQAPVPRSNGRRVAIGVVALGLMVGAAVLGWPGDPALAPDVGAPDPVVPPPVDVGDPALPDPDRGLDGGIDRGADGGPPDAETPNPPPPPPTRAFDRALSRCDCTRARSEHARLARRGVNRDAALLGACGDGRGGDVGRCGAGLEAQIEAAMKVCPCHEPPTPDHVARLAREFGRDVSRRWRRRCVLPGPTSCVGRPEP